MQTKPTATKEMTLKELIERLKFAKETFEMGDYPEEVAAIKDAIMSLEASSLESERLADLKAKELAEEIIMRLAGQGHLLPDSADPNQKYRARARLIVERVLIDALASRAAPKEERAT